ncbi:MAG: phage portal protein [Burkholderiales bacterium]|nr:phage portal protein [Burkholderiales bacterium]
MSQFISRKSRTVRGRSEGKNSDATAFSFGEPELVQRSEIINMLMCESNGKWYVPPISLHALSKAFRSAVYHESPIRTKVNILVSLFNPHKLLSASDFERFILDYFVLANGYLERVNNRLGGVLALRPMPAKFMRRGVKLDMFYFLKQTSNSDWQWGDREAIEYAPDNVLHLLKPDIDQEIYGVPEYLSALPSAWLNNEATVFRLRYYRNGSHAGVILYLTDATQDTTDVDAIKTAMKQSKGPGNFRNLFIYAPNGKKDGLQVIPMSEIAAKDEFFNIKNVTRDDLLAAHRVPRELMSVAQEGKSSAGDLNKIAKVFYANEITPIIARLDELNKTIGVDVFTFKKYVIDEDAQTAQPN